MLDRPQNSDFLKSAVSQYQNLNLLQTIHAYTLLLLSCNVAMLHRRVMLTHSFCCPAMLQCAADMSLKSEAYMQLRAS